MDLHHLSHKYRADVCLFFAPSARTSSACVPKTGLLSTRTLMQACFVIRDGAVCEDRRRWKQHKSIGKLRAQLFCITGITAPSRLRSPWPSPKPYLQSQYKCSTITPDEPRHGRFYDQQHRADQPDTERVTPSLQLRSALQHVFFPRPSVARLQCPAPPSLTLPSIDISSIVYKMTLLLMDRSPRTLF